MTPSRFSHIALGALLLLASLGGARGGAAQETVLFRQSADGSVRSLTPVELAELGDPFLRLVLTQNPNASRLAEVESLLMGSSGQRRVFVVSEEIASSAQPDSRRVIIAFAGENQGVVLDRNVMLSVSLQSGGFPDRPEPFEVWGWDEAQGRYNYYSRAQVQGTTRWVFNGSSDERGQGTSPCLECHVSGAPIMKELFFPWNNWHSGPAFKAIYLTTKPAGAAIRWPVANDPRLAESLDGAENLELLLLTAIANFNRARVDKASEDLANGQIRLAHARSLLRPLFETSEFNIASTSTRSGMHPLDDQVPGEPSGALRIPGTFFFNRDLAGGRGGSGLRGLDLEAARKFGSSSEFQVSPKEYAAAVSAASPILGTARGVDTHFAWLVPEASFVDDDLIEELIQRGLVTREFVAAVLAIDLETPLFSEDRARLLPLVPERLTASPLAQGQDHKEHALTRSVLETLSAHEPAAGTPEAHLLANLQADDPIARLEQAIRAYEARLKQALDASEPARRKAKIAELVACAVERRDLVVRTRQVCELTESASLFPLSQPLRTIKCRGSAPTTACAKALKP